MRQTSWEGLFQPGEEKPTPLTTRLLRLSPISWEEIVTLAIVLVAFATVVESVDSAGWVREMPSLYTVAFIALGLGLVLAKSPLNELSAHLTALIVGIVAVFLSATSSIDGSLGFRVDELYDRMGLWLEAVFTGGISNDNLPFVLLVVLLTYVTAYFAGWSVFRWYNAWLGLIPGGIALLTNASYLPGEGSLSLAIYLFAAILLVARLNVLRGEREWRRERTGYPDLISLHVLNITVWVAFLLVGLAWILPISGGGVFVSAWRSVTAPIAEPLSDLGRVFTAIDTKRGGSVHNFGSTLPLQGRDLADRQQDHGGHGDGAWFLAGAELRLLHGAGLEARPGGGDHVGQVAGAAGAAEPGGGAAPATPAGLGDGDDAGPDERDRQRESAAGG